MTKQKPKIYDKQLVKQRFERSFPTYDENAIVQRDMAEILTDYLFASCGAKHDNILEIGAGTGFLTRHIVNDLNYKKLLVNDIAPATVDYVSKITPYANFLIGDMEALRFDKKFDVILSNASFQWAQDLDQMLKRFYKVLKPEGVIAFSTFGERNFEQLAKVSDKQLMYKSMNELETLFSNFEVKILKDDIAKMNFERPSGVLRHIKNIGANAIASEFWTKGALKDFEQKYTELYTTKNGVELTYHPIYVVLKKK